MPIMYLNEDTRPDFWLGDEDTPFAREVDLSDEFVKEYEEAVMNYDGIQAQLELIWKSKEMDAVV